LSRTLWVIVAAILIVVASGVGYEVGSRTTAGSGSGLPGSTSPPSFQMSGAAVTFTGNAAEDFEFDQSESVAVANGTPGTLVSTLIGVGLTLGAVSSAGSCSESDQYEISSVSVSASGAWVLASVYATPYEGPTPVLLPVFIPWGVSNGGSSCTWGADLAIELRTVDQGPTTQTLYLTVEVSSG
jgi:hypothetical protein